MKMISRRDFRKASAVVGAAAAMTACGGSSSSTAASSVASSAAASSAAASGSANIGVCIYKFDDNFMTTYRTALETILKEKGYEVTVVDGNNDQAKQTEQINTFIAQGVDALIINPVMTSAASSIVNLVQTADIPTVFINREPTAEDMGSY